MLLEISTGPQMIEEDMRVGHLKTNIFSSWSATRSTTRRALSRPRSSLPYTLRPPAFSIVTSLGMASPPAVSQDNGAANRTPYKPRYIDIGINLADPIFRGVYNGKQRHPDDLSGVVDRARQIGCTKLVVTGSSFRSSREALAIAKEYPNTVYTTAGVHPCSSSIFAAAHPHSHDDSGSESAEHTPACDPDPDAPIPDGQTIDPHKTNAIITDLRTLIDDGRKSGGLVAFGEFGLDYDRLHYCSKSLQVHSFNSQLTLAASLSPQLPLFLHSRAAHADFVACLKTAFGDKLEKLERGGVVHSFTGTAKEMAELMELGLFIGLNGCSFKTAENCEVAKTVRLDRLMIETDGPWCEVRPSHDGWKYLVDMDKREREREAALEVLPSPQPEAEAQPGPEPAKMETPSLENRNGEAHQQRPKKQKQQQQSLKKSQQKEPEVLERFRSVKKEKWVEGVMVKSRNEPCMIERVAKIVAGIKGIEVEEVCEAAWRNTVKVFGLNDS